MNLIRYKRAAAAMCMMLCSGVWLSRCVSHQDQEKPVREKPNARQFAGSASCESCHKDIYNSHLHTAHYLSSKPAAAGTLKGSFAPGTNEFAFSAHTVIKMEKRDSGFYQVAYSEGVEKLNRRFDIVIGSGTKGQTSIYWHNNQLYQLPITYFSQANQWSNSPGFPMKATFNRPITSRCLECHTTFVHAQTTPAREAEGFDSSSIIYGIDCERCHGPAAAHVAFQQQHPEEKKARFIVNTGSLSRQLQLDACALCHGGPLQKSRSSFEFLPGDRLADFFTVDTTAPDPNNIDLHGNQYGLLRASKCFRLSQTLTCTSCHNPHKNERDQLAVFSQRCQGCHNNTEHGNQQLCKLSASMGNAITANCIDCHMPAKPSRAIAVFLPGAGSATAALIRSHYISIYPEQTELFLQHAKKPH